MNQFGIQAIPPPLLAFVATVVNQLKQFLFSFLTSLQIYFILHGKGNFESDPEGDEEYQLFFVNRMKEIYALGPKSRKHLFDFLDEEVFGVKRKQATAEQRRQREFSNTQLQAIEAQAAKEDAEQGSVGDEQSEGEGNK